MIQSLFVIFQISWNNSPESIGLFHQHNQSGSIAELGKTQKVYLIDILKELSKTKFNHNILKTLEHII